MENYHECVGEGAHPNQEMGTVLKGSIELKIGKEKKVVEEGVAYRVPPNVVHGGRCLESTAHVLEVFSPPRRDLQ